MRFPIRALLALLLLASTAAACTRSHPQTTVRYVAVGASESVGFGADDPAHQAWPVVFRETALPRSATFVNLGIPGATVADALASEVPRAVELHPTLVTVWLNVNDLTALVSAAAFEQRLDDLVHQLRRGGATRVLVANTPPLDRMPAYTSCRPNPPAGAPPCRLGGLVRLLLPGTDVIDNAVDAYNAATARVVAREGAVLVDLHAVGLAARAAGREAELYGADGFHPSTAGHRAVASAFAAALRASGPLR